MPEMIIETSAADLTLMEWLRQRIPVAPEAYLKQLVKKGRISRDGISLQATDLLKYGDLIRLPDSGRLLELLAHPVPVSAAVKILYESREILVVDKPAGMAIHAGQGHEENNLTAQVEKLLTERGQKFKIAPVHRLDLETSGPVMFGKGKQACGSLGKLFMQRDVEKYYLALVRGKTPGSGRLQSLLSAKGKIKSADTGYRALNRNDQATLLELQLHTGRQHQLRQQLAEQGHPLFGDKRYRGPCPAELPRMFLHCSRLAFVDPFSGAPIVIESPLPDALASFLPQVGIAVN